MLITSKKYKATGPLKTNQAARPVLYTNEDEPRIQSFRDFSQSMGRGVMQRLMAGNGKAQALRSNDLLRKDEWKELDRALVEIATVRLRPLDLLRSRGLVRNLDGLGVLLSQYEQLGDMTDAEISMSGVARTQEDSADFTLNSVPIPVISKDFRINIRRLLASRRGPNGVGGGESIDVTQVRQASRKVAEKMVSMLFNGYGGNLDGNTIKGLTNSTSGNTFSTGGDWGTPDNIYSTILSAKGVLEADYFFGPYGLFVANTQFNQMLQFRSANVTQTTLQAVQQIPQLSFIEPADQLADGTAVMFQLTSDVIDLAIAQDIMVVEWDEHGGLTAQFKVMAAYAPRPKADANGNSGIVYITGI